MPLIKPNQTPPRSGARAGALTLDLLDLQEQADLMIAAARREADETLAAAKKGWFIPPVT